MKMFRKAGLVLGAAGILECCLLLTPSLGATIFAESFTGADGTTSFGPNFVLPASPGNYQIQSNQGANPARDFDTNGNRLYVQTGDADYATIDFIAEITMTRIAGGGSFEGAYFGIGAGVPDGGSFNIPNESMYMEALPGFGPLTRFNRNPAGSGGNVDAAFGSSTAMPAATTSRLRIAKTGNSLQFLIDLGSSTFVTADISSSVIDLSSAPNNFLTGSNSRIFFGGGQNITWDDFTLVPEPSSFTMLLFGSVMLWAVRRKRG